MDSQIYALLAKSDQEKNSEYVKKAYQILDPQVSPSVKEKSAKDVENFSQNLFVECAEKAINYNEIDIAYRCIQIYFSLPMIANQFLARAYLCQFELLAPKKTNELEKLEKSIPFLFKAIEFSKQNKRYHFIIYNASIKLWKYGRAFLKTNFKRHLCQVLKRITNALKEIDDHDFEWRAFLERTLVECYIDNKQQDDAKTLANSLCKFIQSNLPSNFNEYFEFMIQHTLINDDDLKVICGSKWDLNAIYRIEKLKKHKNAKQNNNNSRQEENDANEEAIIIELNEIYKLILPSNTNKKYNKYLTECVNEDKSQFLKSTPSTKSNVSNKKDEQLNIAKRQRLLISLAHVCLLYDEVITCSQIIGYLKEVELINDEFSLEVEFIECEQVVKELKHKQERYTKNVVKLRVEAINKCHETLKHAQRLNNPRLIQMGCMTQWNLCLPLFQPGLRNHVRKPLQYVSECLEDIDSMEWLFRCQLHFELAKCDEEIEQLQTAEQHFLKALQLDDENTYTEQLNHCLKRLRLRGELYKTPDRIEDKVSMILEQCVVGNGKSNKEQHLKPAIEDLIKSLNSKTGIESKKGEINTHSLLLRAADLLAPNEFTRVLESESFKLSFGKINEDQVSRLHKKYLNYENGIKKCENHLTERISDLEREYNRNIETIDQSKESLQSILIADYKERLKLWFDLSKIARKQKIWDICRVSSRFCLLYDNEELISKFLKQQPNSNDFKSYFDRELLRNLAEIHFIFAESLIQFIRGEGIELFEKPKIPQAEEVLNQQIALKQVKICDGVVIENTRNFESDKEWIEYSDWLNKLSNQAIEHFMRGIQIGVQLEESWIVCQGSAYIWNYLHHIFEQKKFHKVVKFLSDILEALKKVGHNTEPELLTAVSIALAYGLMQPWLPQEQIKQLQLPNFPNEEQSNSKLTVNKTKQPNPIAVGSNSKPVIYSIPNEAQPDIKKALDICEFAINVTNGENLGDLITLKERFPLIKTWVLAKQINQSPIKNYGLRNTNFERVQDKFTKCMVSIEILNRNFKMSGQNNFEIKEPPSIKDVINLMDMVTNWPDKLIELEIWSNLAVLSGKAMQTDNLRYSHSKALETLSYFEKRKNENRTVYLTSQYLLGEACLALGEHLTSLLYTTNNSSTNKMHKDAQPISANRSIKDLNINLRRDALNSFADAASYSAKGENYENTIISARYYWNTCLPYLQQAQERATLYENLVELINSLQLVYKFKPPEEIISNQNQNQSDQNKKEEKKETFDEKKGVKKDKVPSKDVKDASTESKKKKEERSSAGAIIEESTYASTTAALEKSVNIQEDAYDDLTLRCVLYACLFQISIDRQNYEEALEQMEDALNELPRTKHRLLIYRFKVITKSKLGLDVQMDLQKFREESEKNMAQMYRKVALSSVKHIDTISCYQRAIEALCSPSSIWLKFEYIIELAQWMFSHEYHLTNCIDLCEWAIDLLMFNFKSEKQIRIVSASSTSKQSKSQTSNKKPKSQPLTNINLLPIAEDKSNRNSAVSAAEKEKISKTVIKQIEINADNQLDDLNLSTKKDNLFDIIPTSENFNWHDLHDIKQLESLIRAHTILAKMCGRSSPEYKNYLLKAYYSMTRLIYQSIDNAIGSIKEIQKLQTANTPAQVDDKKKQDTKKSLVNDSKIQMQTKKNKAESSSGASGYLPQTVDQWSQFEIGEEIILAWSHDIMKKTGLNQHTIAEPFLLFYYLDLLGNMLSELGYSNLLFPLYNLQLILINSLIKFDLNKNMSQIAPVPQLPSLVCYVRLKLINLCTELNLISSISFHQSALVSMVLNNKQQPGIVASPIIDLQNNASAALDQNPSLLFKLLQIDPNEICIMNEFIHSYKQRMAQIENEEAALNSSSFATSSKARSTAIISQSLRLKKKQSSKSLQNVKIDDATSHKIKSQVKQDNYVVDDINLPGESSQVNQSLHETLFKDVWLSIADLLIHNGFYQIARDYIYETLNASIVMEDDYALAKCYYLLGKIALYDCNFIEARNYSLKAQKVAIDELFWFNCIRLLIDSYKYDAEDKEGYEKSLKILNKAIDLIKTVKIKRKNKSNILIYIESIFNYEIAEITTNGLLKGKLNDQHIMNRQKLNKKNNRLNSMHPYLFKTLSQTCDIYQTSIQILIKNGYKRDAIDLIKSHSSLLKQFATDCHNLESKKDYLLQSLNLFSSAIGMLNELFIEITSVQPWPEMQTASLPLQRELVEIKLELARLQTDMLEIHLNQILASNDQNLNKTDMIRTLENFLNKNEDQTETQIQWNEAIAELPDKIAANLISCHSFSIKLKYLRAPTLYLIGRTLRIVASLKLQLKRINLNDQSNNMALNISSSLNKWSSMVNDLIKIQEKQIEHESKQKTKPSKSTEPPQSAKVNETSQEDTDTSKYYISTVNINNIIEQEALKKLLLSANKTEAQAIECLFQAQNIAFSIENKILIKEITYELIELVGRLDIQLCAQLIALYQSSISSIEIENILKKSSLDPKNSLLTSYLHELNFYTKNNTKLNSLNSPIIKHSLEVSKSKFNAFKYLNLNGNHYSLLKDMPTNFIFIILQHNENKNELFGAIIDRAKQNISTSNQPLKQQSKIQTASTSSARSLITKINTDPTQLSLLQQQWKDWKSSMQAFNLKLDLQACNEMLSKIQGTNVNENSFGLEQASNFISCYISRSSSKFEEMIDAYTQLEFTFLTLLEKTENYLKPITEFLSGYFSSTNEDLRQNESGMAKPNEKIILLADLDLFEFPIESLKVFHDNMGICSITRDFSLNFFATRFNSQKENNEVNEDKKDDKKEKAATKIDNKKLINVTQASGDSLPENAIIIDHSRFKYLIDVYNEASPGLPNEYVSISSFKRLINQYSQFTNKWNGITGTDHIASIGECERLLMDSSCFLFNGTERFLSYFNSNKIASLNLNECKLIIINDLAQTNKSYSRVSKADVLKNSSELECENSLEACCLLSLTGVKAILSNQWNSTLVENSEKLSSLLKEFFENKQSCGEFIRYKLSPHIRVILADNQKKIEEKKLSLEKDKGGKNKDTKSEIKSKTQSAKKIEEAKEKQNNDTKLTANEEEAFKLNLIIEEEKQKHLDLLQKLSRLKQENCNMICYGLPDVYFNS